MPFWICEVYYVAKQVTSNTFANITLSVTILKFLIIAVWKRVPVMDDGLLAFFIKSWATLTGSLAGFAKMYAPGRPVFNEVRM